MKVKLRCKTFPFCNSFQRLTIALLSYMEKFFAIHLTINICNDLPRSRAILYGFWSQGSRFEMHSYLQMRHMPLDLPYHCHS